MNRIGSRITQSQVARRAEVSLATVSRVLSGHPMVRPQTRRRTLEVIRQMGYKPDITARALATRKSFLIALLCRETYRQSALHVIQGIQDVLLPSSYSLLVYAHGDAAADEANHLQLALDRGVEGLIVYPALDLDGMSNAERLVALQEQMPVVQMLPNITGLPSIRRNNIAAARLATQHLLELGHRRIVHLTHSGYRDPARRHFYYDAHERWLGYERAMREAGLPAAAVSYEPSVTDVIDADAITRQILNHPLHPTAICAYNDKAVLQVIQAMARQGVSVPGDLSFVGMYENPASELCYPPLTTIRWAQVEMGRRAGRMILDHLAGKPCNDFTFEPELIRRHSVRAINQTSSLNVFGGVN